MWGLGTRHLSFPINIPTGFAVSSRASSFLDQRAGLLLLLALVASLWMDVLGYLFGNKQIILVFVSVDFKHISLGSSLQVRPSRVLTGSGC